jgi:acetyl esterase/lipase
MMNGLSTCLLLGTAAFSAAAIQPEWPRGVPGLLKAGLVEDAGSSIGPGDDPCSGLSLSRGLKYTDSSQNLINIATRGDKGAGLPVLLFVAGESFTNEGTSADWAMRDQAMCLAARNGMVGVSMSYRRAPAYSWPSGAKDVAAAVSWIHQNIDLFGGDARAIIAVGYSVGAFHLASFLGHKELQVADSGVAAAILLSGIYQPAPQSSDDERSYFGADTSKYGDRSTFPGILDVDEPIVLAWSSADPPRLVTEAEQLKERLCGAGHCPRIAELSDRETPASVFDVHGSGKNLAERTSQLIGQIEARGLP